jgi:hypothetical protein
MRAGHTTSKGFPMDRRDALKKLGMGGATVVGATMIVSSPALANPGTQDCAAGAGAPEMTAATGTGSGSNTQLILTYVGLGSITCGCPGAPTLESGPTFAFPAGILSSPTNTTNPSIWTGVPAAASDFTVTLRVRCIDPNGLAVCSIVTATGNASRNGSTLTVNLPTALTTSFTADLTECPPLPPDP